MNLSELFVIAGEVVNEGAIEAQTLHQGAHLSLQGTASVHPGAKRFWNAEVFPQNNHVHLKTEATQIKHPYACELPHWRAANSYF